MFCIGNIKNHQPLEDIAKTLTIGGGGTNKIYGVHFDIDNPDPNIGIRLYDSVGLRFEPSTLSDTGIDEFAIPGSPFDIKDVMMDYNPSTGKQEVIGTEDDSNWNTLVEENTFVPKNEDSTLYEVPQHNWMVRFPKFYYKRPDRYTWLVSSDPIPEFSPSPMHYRNGVMHDYVYISKYCLDYYSPDSANIPNPTLAEIEIRSCSNDGGQIGINGGGLTIDEAIRKLIANGMYVFDYAAYCSIAMLIMIKYGYLRTDYVYQNTALFDTGDGTTKQGICKDILSKDGINAPDIYSVINGDQHTGTMTLGLENYVSNSNGIMINGCGWRSVSTNKIEFYIKTDLESITNGIPDFSVGGSDMIGFVKLNNLLIGSINNSSYNYGIGYDPTFNWAIYPDAEVGKTPISGKTITNSRYFISNSINDGAMKMVDPGTTSTTNRYDFLNFGLNKTTRDKNKYFRSIVY